MKLNLLPTYVSKEKVTRTALLFSILVFVVCVLASVFLTFQGGKDLEASKEGIAELKGKADLAKATADKADVVMAKSEVLIRNTQLAQAMIDHNAAFPKLYDDIKPYIPSFYRVNSVSAAATGPGQCTVTLVGVLDTYQQYADLMLALLRMPGVQSVSRSGFNNTMAYVPAPTPEDQIGKPHKPGEQPIPDNPYSRLDYFLAKGGTTGFTGTGGFGSGEPGIRTAMPGASDVTVTLVISGRDIQTPDPRATLAANGAATGGTGNAPATNTSTAPAPTRGGSPSTTPSPSSGGGGGGGGRRGRGAGSQSDEE